jgi:L-fuculose-phosphate aldolase
MNKSVQEKICEISKKLLTHGLNHGATGNVSVRIDNDFYITPSGMATEWMEAKDVVKCSLLIDEEEVSRMTRKPSSEWHFHQQVYQTRSDVNAIVHTHSPYASAISVLRKNIPAFHYMIALFGGSEVRCSAYEIFGSRELSQEIIKTLGTLKACLIANHGAVLVSNDLENAFYLAQELEHLAHQYIELLKIGSFTLLSEDEMTEVLLKFKSYGPSSQAQD